MADVLAAGHDGEVPDLVLDQLSTREALGYLTGAGEELGCGHVRKRHDLILRPGSALLAWTGMRYPDDPDEPLREDLVNNTRDGATWVDWYCAPPPDGAGYEVTREEPGGWRTGHPVRCIFEIRVTGGTVPGQVVRDAGEPGA